ncbi:glycosyltransferase family 2 protein [soil metagenome]
MSITVVIPARDEIARLGPLLAALQTASGVAEVIVVDDESTDGTADLAARAGATVVAGRPLPTGWVGKAWALQQGLAAASSEWVVTLDADTRPDPALPLALVERMRTDDSDLITAAGRFDCPTAPLRWLHPALLTTLLYRVAPPGALHSGPVHRRMGNGQCMAFRRATLIDAGGFAPVAHHTVEDVALVRGLAVAGYAVDLLDATSLLQVRMYESARSAWSGWGRSLSLPGVDPMSRRAADLFVVAVAQAAPLVRLVGRRADPLDVVLLAVRLGTLVGTRRAYGRRAAAYWLSPLADPLAVLALVCGLIARRQRWRGRVY